MTERTERKILESFISKYNTLSLLCEVNKYKFQQTQTLDEKVLKKIHDYQIKMSLLDEYINYFAIDLGLNVTNKYCDTFNDDTDKLIYKYNKYQIIE